jgi:transposase
MELSGREQRGVIIAAMCKLTCQDGVWLVPSQTEAGKQYKVNPDAGSCTCPDCTEGGYTCKHQFAVQYTLKREMKPDGSIEETRTVTFAEKKVYSQDWKSYNAAQTSEGKHFRELLAELCATIEEPARPACRGRKPLPLSDMFFSAIYKIYSTFSARRFASDLEDAHQAGFITKLPKYNTVLSIFVHPKATPIMHDLICKSSLPLAQIERKFAVDSSGFCTSKFIKWFDVKYGITREKAYWVKCHLISGVTTNIVPAVQILDQYAGDSPQFSTLVKSTSANFTVDEVSADKAYASAENFQLVEDLGGKLYAAFKSNTTGAVGGTFEKMYHQFCLNKDEYMDHYHKRSNVESTFSMIKRKHGDSVRSKNETAMRNEVLAKVVCHNLCCLISARYELGIEPTFRQNGTCLENGDCARILSFSRA